MGQKTKGAKCLQQTGLLFVAGFLLVTLVLLPTAGWAKKSSSAATQNNKKHASPVIKGLPAQAPAYTQLRPQGLTQGLAQGLDRNAFNQLSALEEQLFGLHYNEQNADERLSRLEQTVFGESHPERSPYERLTTLRELLNSQQALPQQALQNNALGHSAGSHPSGGIDQSYSSSYSSAAATYPAATYHDEPVNTAPAYSATGNSQDYPIMTEMERRVLGQSFEQEDLARRLDRLESRVWGQPQPAGSLMSRVDALHQAVLGSPSNAADNTQAAPDFYTPPDLHQPDAFNQALIQAEWRTLKTQYPLDPTPVRLSRLEMQIFHTEAPPGVTDEDRLQRILAVNAGNGTEKPVLSRRTTRRVMTWLPYVLMVLPLFL